MSSFHDVLGVIVLRLRVFDVSFFVSRVVVVEVVQSVYFIGITLCSLPHLVAFLKLFALFFGRVVVFLVTFEPSVTDYFVDHLEVILLCV